MERIDEEDIDCFLLRTEQIYRKAPEKEKIQEEWHHMNGFMIWIPRLFQPADRKITSEIFWSDNRPDKVFLTEQKTEGITLQVLSDAEILCREQKGNPMEKLALLLQKLDDRTVCYSMGETEGRVKVYWLEYKSFAAEKGIYNLLFLFQAGKKKMLGTFYCPFDEYDRWKPIVLEMMQTIKEDADEGI
ncbi:MAG: hypothetical protein J6D08_13305 [Lachnospiraceae bacterium]|nr:hypothetical protein [Lachnospiraceae bacterium]